MASSIWRSAALVTGASSGLGQLYAERLARRGYNLVLVARDEARMARLAERLRADLSCAVDIMPADLTVSADVDRVAARLRSDETISLLVNNAGASLTSAGILGSSDVSLRGILALNVVAATLLAAAAAQTFPDRPDAGIINVGSVIAFMPERFDGVYGGTKAHTLALSLSLRAQLAGRVRVQAVVPGATRTEIWARSGKNVDAFPAEIVMTAEDLVDAALAGYDRDEAVTIPSLHDESLWAAFEQARHALAPHLNNRQVAPRYAEAATS